MICGVGALTLGAFAWWILPGVQRSAEELQIAPLPSDTLA